MRVLHVHGDLIAGGGQTLSREWLRAVDRSRLEPYVVVLNEPLTLADSFEHAGIPVTKISGSRPVQILRLARFIRKNNIDIVHSQSEPDRKVAHWAALLTRRRVIAHLHSEWVYFEKPSEASTLIGRFRAWIAFRVRKISEHSVAHLVPTSQSVYDAFEPFAKRPMTTVEPGVAITTITDEQHEKYRAALHIKPDEFLIVNLSRLDPVKNLEDFIRVIRELVPEKKVRAIIAGEGPLRKNLVDQVHSCGLYREVQVFHAVEDPIELLGAADMFLATSTYESFGISVLEALSAGVPVVGYNLNVYDRYNGAVRKVELGDIEGLARNAKELIENKEAWKQSRASALHAAEKYNIIRGTNELIALDEKYAYGTQS